jgi:hypothetical protein
MKSPAMRPRPGGGFNPGIGHFTDHLDEQAMQQAMKQKALSQMAGAQTGPSPAGGAVHPFAVPGSSGGSGLPPGAGFPGGLPGNFPSSVPGADQAGMHPDAQTGASPDVFQAVVSQPIMDMAKTFLGALHLDKLLGLASDHDTPEEKAQKNAMHKRYEQLTQEQQSVAQQMYQRRLQEEKVRKQEAEQRQQQEERLKSQSVAMPSSPQKGPVGPSSGKSKKSNAIQKLQQDRKTLGGPQSAG